LVPEAGDYFAIYGVDETAPLDLIDFKPWN
jgi:hypothetical protein